VNIYLKKKIKIYYKIRDIGRDTLMNKLFTHFNLNSTLMLYNIISANPIDIIIGIIASKLGLSKVIVLLIIAFI